MTETRYKILLVGDGGVGKTAMLKRLLFDEFEKRYMPTMGVEIRPYDRNNILYDIWDCAGQEKYSNTLEQYFPNSNLAIIMCSESKLTHKTVNLWKRNIQTFCPDIPIITVRNKCDINGPTTVDIDFLISTKNNTGIDEIFDEVERILEA